MGRWRHAVPYGVRGPGAWEAPPLPNWNATLVQDCCLRNGVQSGQEFLGLLLDALSGAAAGWDSSAGPQHAGLGVEPLPPIQADAYSAGQAIRGAAGGNALVDRGKAFGREHRADRGRGPRGAAGKRRSGRSASARGAPVGTGCGRSATSSWGRGQAGVPDRQAARRQRQSRVGVGMFGPRHAASVGQDAKRTDLTIAFRIAHRPQPHSQAHPVAMGHRPYAPRESDTAHPAHRPPTPPPPQPPAFKPGPFKPGPKLSKGLRAWFRTRPWKQAQHIDIA
jgi:hypothetical protein